MGEEANLVRAFRAARRDFIAAAEALHADVVSRVHPAKGPDGMPLFCDTVVLGPRGAAHALLLIAGPDGTLTMLLKQGIELPGGAKLLAVHAPDPFAGAWGKEGVARDWPQTTLAAIAAEDLARAKKLTVLDFTGGATESGLAAALPGTAIIFRAIKPEHAAQALSAAIAGL